MSKKLIYNGEFGYWEFDVETGEFVDKLDRDLIWEAAGEDYIDQQIIYSDILYEAGVEKYAQRQKRRFEHWAGRETDFGCEAYLDNGLTVRLDAEGTFVWEEER